MIRKIHIVFFSICIILYINIISALLLQHLSDLSAFLPVLKDVSIFILLATVIYFLRENKFKIIINKYHFLFVFLILFCFFATNEAILNRIYNLRRIILPIIIFIIFSNLKFTVKDKNIYFKFMIYNFLIFLIFGLFEYFFTNFFWKTFIDINLYWNKNIVDVSKKIDIFTEGGRLYTSDTIAFFGYKFRRMISISLEPTTFATLMLFFSTLFIYNKKYILFFLCTICGFLTLSKLFIIGVFLVIFQKVFRLYNPVFLVLGTIILFITSQFIAMKTDKLHGSFSHVKGFYSGVTLLSDHPFGFGLGIAGNRGSSNISTINGDFGGESGFGNVTAQVGYVGLLYIFILFRLYCKFYKYKDYKQNQICLSLVVQYLLNFYLSASSMGVLSFFFIFSYLGMNYRR